MKIPSEYDDVFPGTDERPNRVALTMVGEDRVSTVLLHGHLPGEPESFETMVTSGPHKDLTWRWTTLREALDGHFDAVNRLVTANG